MQHDKVCAKHWWVIIVAALALVGCGQGAPEEASLQVPTPTVLPTATATLPPPTLAPSATPQPSVTPTPSPSPTPTRTATPTATATTTPTPTATSEPTKAPLAEAAAAGAPAPSAAGAVAAAPKGASLFYQPEFAGVAPQGDAPGHPANVNPLSGQPASNPALLQRRPILVRYGNDRAARPHAGVSQAEVVFEDLMDAWWITRLTAVYLEQEPAKVGSVRSARPVNIEILPAFNGVLVFSGASIGVTQLLAGQPFDLIHEDLEGDLFYRSSDRAAPHNLYTSVAAVRQRLALRGKEYAVDLRSWTFDPTPPPGQPVSRLDIPYPASSTVAWTWDAATGVYRRWVQGAAYTDLNTGQQVGCENVVLLYARHWESDIVEDSLGSRAIGIALKGGERAQILRDGVLIEGYWWRAEANRLWQFVDGNGNRIPLKPGHTWIQLVPTSYQVGLR